MVSLFLHTVVGGNSLSTPPLPTVIPVHLYEHLARSRFSLRSLAGERGSLILLLSLLMIKLVLVRDV